MACIGVILIETNCLWMRYTRIHVRIYSDARAVPFSIKIDTPEDCRRNSVFRAETGVTI